MSDLRVIRRAISLTSADIAEYAAASRDTNPLHTDDDYARLTPYGGTVAHGALVVTTALADVPAAAMRRPCVLTARFSRPVHPDVPYEVETASEGGAVRVTVRLRGDTAVAVRLEAGTPRSRPAPATPRASAPPAASPVAKVWSQRELRAGMEFSEEYTPDLAELRALADRHGAGQVPDAVLTALAWSSWVAGMQMPGRDGLFAGLLLAVDGDAPSPIGPTRIQVRDVDSRTGAVTVDASSSGGPLGSAEAELRTFVRARVPTVTRASMAAELTPGTGLAGRCVLVSGGSRGLGAALTGAFAAQGATVWSLHARSHRRLDALRAEFGQDRVRPVTCDVLDDAQVAGVRERLAAERVVLNGVVLCAAPSIPALGTGPEAVPAIADFVRRSVAMALNPLAAARSLFPSEHGWVILVSSAAVAAAPDGWGHYAAAKAALEQYVTYFGHRHRLRTLVLRAPKMHTDLVNGPTGAIGATPVERVAAAAVRWVRDGAPGDDVTVLDWAGIGAVAKLSAAG